MTLIKIDVDKYKQIAHDKRRISRQVEFAPYDDLIAKRIPGLSFEELEAKREQIRAKYHQLQIEIDAATSKEQLKSILDSFTM